MQQYSADLLALYASAPAQRIFRAHLFKIGPCRNGQMIYATDGRSPISYNDGDGLQQYHPWLYGFWGRGEQTVKIGLESNSIDLPLFSDEEFQPIYFPGTSNQVYFMDGVYAGLLAGAPVSIYRASMTTWGVVIGPTGGSLVSTRFVGEVGEIKNLGPTRATVTVRDLMYRLNADCPQMLIQANCRWVLYSPGCTLNKASFTRTGAIGTISDPRTFVTAAHITPVTSAGTFSKGIITFTSGKNNGIAYTCALWTPGADSGPDTIQLDRPPLFNMTDGDAFTITQGCDHTFPTCLDFQGDTNAYLNFGGTPFVPTPETAV